MTLADLPARLAVVPEDPWAADSDLRHGLPGEQPGEQRAYFEPDLREPQRTPTDFRNAQVFAGPENPGPPRTSANFNGRWMRIGWRFDPARLHHFLPLLGGLVCREGQWVAVLPSVGRQAGSG